MPTGRSAVDEFLYVRRDMPAADIRLGAAHLARRERIDRIVALDDFDVEPAARTGDGLIRRFVADGLARTEPHRPQRRMIPRSGETCLRRFPCLNC